MAQKYGGRFSPGGAQTHDRKSPYADKRPAISGTKSALLFVAPFPLVFRAFSSDPVGMAINLAAFGLLLAAAYLTRQGLMAQEAYEARTVAKRPAIPRKLFGSVLTGAGLFLAGYTAEGSLLDPVIFGVLGAGLHSLAFGLDPMADKTPDGADSYQSERVARAVDEAEQHLSAMTEAIKPLGDRRLEGRVERFQSTAREMFRTVERDPRDLTAARRFLGVYLLGARDATVKFATLYKRNRDPAILADYEALLDDLERSFSDRTKKLMLDDRSGLDVEIEVLRERLAREGVRNGLID